MKDVFDKCQAFERDRLVKFKEFFATTEKCLDLKDRLQFVSIFFLLFVVENFAFFFSNSTFQQFSQMIKNCEPDRDLSWWSDTYGATMKMNWPIFEVRIIECFLFFYSLFAEIDTPQTA